MTPTARTGELRRIAERICAALPPDAEEVVLTGSVSRGVADEVSFAERIEQTLTEPDPLCALLVMSELQADVLALAPSGPNVDRARRWVEDAIDVLRSS